MTLKPLLSLIFVFTAYFSFTQNNSDYAAGTISPALLKNACAVKRYEEIRFEIINPGKAFYHYKRALTILNERGDKYAGWAEGMIKTL